MFFLIDIGPVIFDDAEVADILCIMQSQGHNLYYKKIYMNVLNGDQIRF